MFSNRALVSLAVPIVLDSFLAILAGFVDTAMVSTAGEAAVSAVSLVDNVNMLFIYLMSAMATGGAVVTAQYIGSKNITKAKTAANQLIYISVAVSLAIMLPMLYFAPGIIHMVYGQIETAVFENCKTYFFYILIGYPFFAIGTSCSALLRSMAKSKPALFIAAAVNVLNVIGNAVLIYGFDMGVAGAAISTTFSRVVWAAVSLWMLHSKSLAVHFEKLFKFRIDFDIMRRVTNIGMANGLENSLFQLGKILVSSLISTFGTIAIAANSVANTVLSIGWNTIGSFGTTLLTVVGQCMGAGEYEQAKMYTKKIANFGLIAVFVLFGSIFLLRNQIVGMFSFGPEALAESAKFVGIGALLTIGSVYAWSFMPMHSFRAAGDTRYALVLSVSSMFTFRVALSYLLGSYFKMGLLGVWLGMWADWICRAILNIIRYRSGKWLTKKVI